MDKDHKMEKQISSMNDKLKKLHINDKYKLSEEAIYLIPTTSKSAIGEDVLLPRIDKEEWVRVFETSKTSIIAAAEMLGTQCCPPSCMHWDDGFYVNRILARLVVANIGAYLCGPAGVGKIILIRLIKEEILRDSPRSAYYLDGSNARCSSSRARMHDCTRPSKICQGQRCMDFHRCDVASAIINAC